VYNCYIAGRSIHKPSSVEKMPILIAILCLFLNSLKAYTQKTPVQTIPVAKVWSGHSVGFDLLTTDQFQYVTYYDSERNMVIVQRPLASREWKRTILPSKVGWDSHNYIHMTIDKKGFIHVSGNMHGVPLIYFRSEKPEDIGSFEKLSMTGKNEDRVTYPVFFKDQSGDLYFQYRNGGSGNGITYWNKYNADKQQWTGLFDTPFFDGESEANAYMTNPQLGPDGYFYVIWMWRLTPIANTNHNLSCIRSKDLLHWESMNGQNVSLPVKWRDTKAVVDPVGPWNGLINMGFQINFDHQKTPYISYHKYDKNGVSQVFITRWEKDKTGNGRWNIYQISDWKDFTWELNLNGSLRSSVSIAGVAQKEDYIKASITHEKHGSGTWILDKTTLKIKQTLPAMSDSDYLKIPPIALEKDMVERRKNDNTGRFIMQWQTLPTFRDKPREGPTPAPVDLIIYETEQ
jgi:hypothetical protein